MVDGLGLRCAHSSVAANKADDLNLFRRISAKNCGLDRFTTEGQNGEGGAGVLGLAR